MASRPLGVKRRLIFILLPLFVTCSAWAQYQYDVRIRRMQGEYIENIDSPFKRKVEVLILAVLPRVTDDTALNGFDLQNNQILAQLPRDLHPTLATEIPRHYMNVIENAYHQIAIEKGLFKRGDPFFESLRKSEPFFDGRSAAIGIFETTGDGPVDFSNPRATIRVSYSIPDAVAQALPGYRPGAQVSNEALPFMKRLGIKTEYLSSAIQSLQDPVEALPNHRLAELGLSAKNQHAVNFFGQQFANTQTPEGQLFAWILNTATGNGANLSSEHNFRLPDGRKVPIAMLMEKVSEALGRPVKVGGMPAELKALSHKIGASGIDYMDAIFAELIELGLLDFIPYGMRIPSPKGVLVETTEELVDKAYHEWNMKRVMTLGDLSLKGDILIARLGRAELSKLGPLFFARAAPWMTNKDLHPRIVERTEHLPPKELMNLSVFQTMTQNPAPYPIDQEQIFAAVCRRAYGGF